MKEILVMKNDILKLRMYIKKRNYIMKLLVFRLYVNYDVSYLNGFFKGVFVISYF